MVMKEWYEDSRVNHKFHIVFPVLIIYSWLTTPNLNVMT